MNQQMFPVFLGLMIVSTIAWFFLSKRLYGQLKNQHPDIFESLGSPESVVRRRSDGNTSVIRFILYDYKRRTDNPSLHRLCEGLRYILLIFGICLLGCAVLLVDFMLT